ncbi:hypothetical protein [Cellulomonas endophytica]|uniref:hypothetical protein n=1 Tax=Cellulomonas endophytica TaxID=2494735 RepID=UPI00101181A2|nr:hypothetical protein [Cellulomonas endophytica]
MTTTRTPSSARPFLALLTGALLLATAACGGGDGGSGGSGGAGSGSSDDDVAAAVEALAPEADEEGTPFPAACTVVDAEDVRATTGYAVDPGVPSPYDEGTCTFDDDSDRITVRLTADGELELSSAVGVDVVPVAALPGATRVDGVVHAEVEGGWLVVSTGLAGIPASERDAAGAEALAVLLAGRLAAA